MATASGKSRKSVEKARIAQSTC